MTPSLLDLGRRAVKCKRFPRPDLPRRPVTDRIRDDLGILWIAVIEVDEPEVGVRFGVWLPDLSDPATLGCLLALVREAWGPYVHAEIDVGGWRIRDATLGSSHTTVGLPVWDQPTEAHALVAALEAAPEPR